MTEYLEKAESLTRLAVFLGLAAGIFFPAAVKLAAGILRRRKKEGDWDSVKTSCEGETMFLSEEIRGRAGFDEEEKMGSLPGETRQRGGDRHR